MASKTRGQNRLEEGFAGFDDWREFCEWADSGRPLYWVRSGVPIRVRAETAPRPSEIWVKVLVGDVRADSFIADPSQLEWFLRDDEAPPSDVEPYVEKTMTETRVVGGRRWAAEAD